MNPITLALDLEGTLISNAMSQLPRQGLYAFMEGCAQRFERVVIFSAVRAERTRAILETLAAEGDVPSWVGMGSTKICASLKRRILSWSGSSMIWRPTSSPLSTTNGGRYRRLKRLICRMRR